MIGPSSPLRIAISGCGAVSERYYAPALRAPAIATRVRVVALADPDPGRRALLATRFPGAAASADLAAALATTPDLVIVASPAPLHAPQAIAALEAGAAVLCEKPLASTRADAERMIAAATASGRLLAIGMVRRRLPAARTIRRLLAERLLGMPIGVTVFEGGPFAWPIGSSAYFARANGGVVLDLGAHLVDLLTWWFGRPEGVVVSDDAMGGVEANALVTLHAGDVPAHLRLSRDWHRPNHVTINGTRGTVHWDLDDPAGVVLTLGDGPPLAITPAAGESATFEAAFAAQLGAVVDACAGLPAEVVTAADVFPSLVALTSGVGAARRMTAPWLGPEAPLEAARARQAAAPSRPTVAVVGANGFIGSRVVEMLHLGGAVSVRPVVRRASALAGAARFAGATSEHDAGERDALDGRVADARDAAALRAALAGADFVVHCVAGDPATIVASADAVYRAAAAAGCRRLVYLSSASVHGQAPEAGTDERSPLNDRQPLAYNNAKVAAERRLAALRSGGRLELVVLRPGIVFGPRSTWITHLVDGYAAGTAHFVGRADGICNSLYVDNLVHAIELALTAERADGATYLLGDAEAPTWRELYRPFVEALGGRVEDLPVLSYVPPSFGLAEAVDRVRASAPVQATLRRLPERLRLGLVAFYAAAAGGRASLGKGATAPAAPVPTPTYEMALLHGCRHRLPWTKAERELGYRPPVGFDEAVRRTIAWLAFAGYPVRNGVAS